MKKIISIVLLVLMFVITLGTYASAVSEANEATYTTSTTYFEDGSYIITTISEESLQLQQNQEKRQPHFIIRIMLHSGPQHYRALSLITEAPQHVPLQV